MKLQVLHEVSMKCITHLIFFLFLTVWSFSAFCQVSYSPAVISSYDSVFNRLDPRLQKMVNNPENKMRGVVLLTGFKLDTLNKQDFTGVVRKDTLRSGYVPEKVLTPDLMVGRAKANGDSLTISVSPWFMMGDEIKHKIANNQASSTYIAWEKEGRVFAGNSSVPDAKNLQLNATASLVLSDKHFAPGKTIYGSGVLLTDDFSQINAPDFKGNTVRLRMKYSYVFKLIALKDDGF